jgi:putative Mg2+ transporter-C (MgtC) family protein
MEGIREGIDFWVSLETVGLAALLGGVIGLERELADKPAGLRTHILVAVAAALFVILGFAAVETFREHDLPGVRTDPIRILQAIVIGVSFLGAGTILRDRSGEVEGLTTAASVLIAASLGAAVALGQDELAAVVAVSLAVLLPLLARLENALVRRRGGGEKKDATRDASRL